MNWIIKLLILMLLNVYSKALSAESLTENVIVDYENTVIYIQSQNGKVRAINIKNGLMLWESSSDMKPLMLIDDELLVQLKPKIPGQINLAYLSRQEGLESSSINVPISHKVNAVIGQNMNESFLLTTNNNELFWKYSQQKNGAQLLEEKALIQYGKLSFNLQNRALTNSLITRTQYPKINKLADILNGVKGTQLFSENKQHILVVNNDESARDSYYYSWEYYNLSGEKLAEIKSQHGYSPFLIVGNLLIYTQPESSTLLANNSVLNQPLSLNVYDLDKKKIIWNESIYNLNYRGKVAP